VTVTATLPTFAPRHEVQRIVAEAGSSFATGMRVLPRPRRDAIFAVYAFCRVVDDIADGEGDGQAKLARLAWWEDEIDRVFAGRPRAPVGDELALAVRRFDLPREEFDLILEGMRMDAGGISAPDFSELDRYVRCVAGAVGVLSMRVFGAWRGERSRRFALALAKAMQLTNILRDVEEDAGLGRLYLPGPILEAAGVPADPRLAWFHPRLPEARRLLGLLARSQFRRAAALSRGHDWPRVLPALLMMGPYEALLGRMEADWSRRPARRPALLKLADGVACAARGLVRR
jgi:squalene synthase HpnD